MTPIPIDLLSVLVAAFAGMAVGFAWYGPLFGKQWVAMMGWTPQQMEEGRKKMQGAQAAKTYLLAFLGTAVMAYVLAHSIFFAAAYYDQSGTGTGLQGAFWSWLGFVVPVMLGKVLWKGKSWKLFAFDSGHYLASLAVMGIILSNWS